MAVFGITGWSGSGKTTLIERLIPLLSARGLTVGVLKHAHHSFDIDQPQKDSHRFRSAGCRQVAVSSARRWAFVHEHAANAPEATMEDMLARFVPTCDLVLVEGYKNAPLPKLEVWRQALTQTPLAANNRHVAAVATDDDIGELPTHCVRLPLHDGVVVADFILRRARP